MNCYFNIMERNNLYLMEERALSNEIEDLSLILWRGKEDHEQGKIQTKHLKNKILKGRISGDKEWIESRGEGGSGGEIEEKSSEVKESFDVRGKERNEWTGVVLTASPCFHIHGDVQSFHICNSSFVYFL